MYALCAACCVALMPNCMILLIVCACSLCVMECEEGRYPTSKPAFCSLIRHCDPIYLNLNQFK